MVCISCKIRKIMSEVRNKMNMTNLKNGTKILLKVSRNGLQNHEGTTFEIVRRNGNAYICKFLDKTVQPHINIYHSGTKAYIDDFCLLDRKERAKYLKEELKTLKVKGKEIEKEIAFLEKYETEEDYVAEKLDAILKAPNKHKIAEILRELKKTDYL